ncbi:MAG: carbohydrate kinase family protein [Patescibacteria group bacterium]|jgi:sugar/nucleoside kinase (ribokinase family)|nr:carbohydrate kinase family protein [Patescibacteria group bacterium]
MNEQFDVISVGDIVTDAFIKLIDDNAQIIENDQKRLLAMEFGTKIPFDHAEIIEAVGNASNAAVAFAKLGLGSAYVTNVGGDAHGRDMIQALHNNGVDTHLVRINHDKKSNYHYVLWYKEERTILIRHEDYDYQWPHLREKEKPRWIYLSSVSEHCKDYHDQISDWLDQNPEIKLAFQPGTFQMEFGVERMSRIYNRSEVLILNREEAVTVGGGNHQDINDLLDKLHQIGPKIVVITDGPNGAYLSDGSKRLQMPLYPDPAPPIDRTGAGDSFASTFVAALIKGKSTEEALMWAPINSMNVVQRVGAQAGLLTEYQLDNFLKNAPDWYYPKSIN